MAEAEARAGAAACDGECENEGDGRRRHKSYAEKLAAVEAVCRRIETGLSLAEACRRPDAPAWSTMQWWLGRYRELRALVDAAQAEAAEAYGARRAHHRWSPKVAAEVLRRMEDGRGLDEVCAERDMPAYSTVMRWIKTRPDYFDAYMLARETQADRLFDLAWGIALEATEATTKTARLKIQTLKWRCAKLAPRRYGTIRAQPPADQADDAGDAAGASTERVVQFEPRHFAVTPDNQVVETTRAVRGMSPQAGSAFRQAIREGRITLTQLAALNAGGEPVNAAPAPRARGRPGRR